MKAVVKGIYFFRINKEEEEKKRRKRGRERGRERRRKRSKKRRRRESIVCTQLCSLAFCLSPTASCLQLFP